MSVTTPWFWDTPDGGGWVHYWRGEFYSATCVRDQLDLGYLNGPGGVAIPLTAEQRADFNALLADDPGRRKPTRAERGAWREIDPSAEGQKPDEDEEPGR